MSTSSAAAEEEHRIFPEEQISVTPSRAAIVLSGHVTTEDVAKRAGELASAYSKKCDQRADFGPVGAQEVMLEVKFAEVDRSALNPARCKYFFHWRRQLDRNFNHRTIRRFYLRSRSRKLKDRHAVRGQPNRQQCSQHVFVSAQHSPRRGNPRRSDKNVLQIFPNLRSSQSMARKRVLR